MGTSKHQVIRDIIKEENPDALFLEPEFDKALIGTCLRYGRKTVAAYNTDICLKTLMEKHGCDDIDAYEKFHNSLDCTDKEENQPVFINDFRKIKIIKKENFKLTDTIGQLGTNDPS
jgi:hypothetical protein